MVPRKHPPMNTAMFRIVYTKYETTQAITKQTERMIHTFELDSKPLQSRFKKMNGITNLL